MFSRSILKTFLLAAIALAASMGTATTAGPSEATAPASVGSFHTYLMPDLSLKSVFSVPLLPTQPDLTRFKGSCACSCARFNCNTDADCGPGGVCLSAPTCCVRSTGTQWFQGVDQSSRKTELPAFKASCK